MAAGGIVQSKSQVNFLVAYNPRVLGTRKGRQYDAFYYEERDLARLFPHLNCGYLHFTNTQACEQATTIWKLAQVSNIIPSHHYATKLEEQDVFLLKHVKNIKTSEFLLLKQMWKIKQLTTKA